MFDHVIEMRAECSKHFCVTTWRFDDILNKLQICTHWSYFFGSLDCGSVEICTKLREQLAKQCQSVGETMHDHDESPCRAVIRFDEVLIQLCILCNDGRGCYFNSGEEMSYYACLTLRGSNASV